MGNNYDDTQAWKIVDDFFLEKCAQEDSNLHVLIGHQPLKLARLPIPPCALKSQGILLMNIDFQL